MANYNDVSSRTRSVDEEAIDDLLRRAADACRSGYWDEGRALLEQVLTLRPESPDANHNMGALIMLRGGSLRDALPFFSTAWAHNPRHPQYGISYVRALARSGNLTEAKRVHDDGVRRGLAWPPLEDICDTGPAAAVNSRANIRASENEPSRVDVEQFESVLISGSPKKMMASANEFFSRYPAHAPAWRAFAIALYRSGLQQKALGPLRHAWRMLPNDAELCLALGVTLRRGDLLAEAEAVLREAVRNSPNEASMRELALVLGQQGQYPECEKVYLEILAKNRNSLEANFNLAGILMLQKRYPDALPHLTALVQSKPKSIEARVRLAKCLKSLKRIDEMGETLTEGLKLSPDSVELLREKADYFACIGDLDGEEGCHQRILEITPEDVGSSGTLVAFHATRHDNPEANKRLAVAWSKIARKNALLPFREWSLEGSANKLRVGLVSGDLRNHPVGYFIDSMLKESMRLPIEWIAYPTASNMDEHTSRLRSRFTAWHSIDGLSDEDAARVIHDDKLNILIDLSGHTNLNRLPVFAWRPAPVQLSWLGYFGTTGLYEIDYILADEQCVPPIRVDDFCEDIFYLPDVRYCFSAPDDVTAVGACPALSNKYITFGSFQRTEKISDDVLSLWAQVLNRVPGSRLRLQSDRYAIDSVRERTLERLETFGVDAARVEFHGHVERSQYLVAYSEVDLILDTFPYTGGTTTCEALWMGVPTVTLGGKSMIARQGVSILSAAGYPKWVATKPSEYVEKACELARDIDALAALRMNMRKQVEGSPLFDSKKFSHNFHSALQKIWSQVGVPRLLRCSDESGD